MDKQQSSSDYYHQRAAELRALAHSTSNFAVAVELENTADNYDELAEWVEKETLPPLR